MLQNVRANCLSGTRAIAQTKRLHRKLLRPLQTSWMYPFWKHQPKRLAPHRECCKCLCKDLIGSEEEAFLLRILQATNVEEAFLTMAKKLIEIREQMGEVNKGGGEQVD